MLSRTNYLDKIVPFIDNELIKVITGVRRSGKSVILNQVIDYLFERGIKEEQVIYVNMESRKNRSFKNPDIFHEYVINKVTNDEKYYIFVDEVQLIDEWEDVINSFRVDFNSSIFITGSNANLLSGELATLLAGRYISFNIFPFSYKEYCKYQNKDLYDEKVFYDYIMFGGFPTVSNVVEIEHKQAVIADIIDSIVYRDVMLRTNASNNYNLSKFVEYILSQTGQIFSAKSIANYLKSERISINETTIGNYLELIINSRLVSKCSRYDIKGKKTLKREEKYYVSDLGLINHTIHFDKINKGSCIETIVYNQLVSTGHKVYIGKQSQYEVDFVAFKNNEIKYIQVSLSIVDNDTKDREFRSLEIIKDNYPKYLITLDKINNDRNGIKHIYLLDYLNNPDIL